MDLTTKVNNIAEVLAIVRARIAARPEMQEQVTRFMIFFAEWYGQNSKLFAKLFDEELEKFLNEGR